MKTYIYLIATTFIFTTACKSVEKLVDQGRYDEAIVLSTKKLAGKKNKKTKHIKALEKAFDKLNAQNLDYISLLRAKGSGENWEEIYNYASHIRLTQERVRPFMPLVSKDGYVGDFDFINVNPLLDEAGSKMSAFLYRDGSAKLTKAKTTQNKLLAQKAHRQFERIGRYYDTYKDVNTLMEESLDLGRFYILLKMDESIKNYIGINHFIPLDVNTKWIAYYDDHQEGVSFDAVSSLYIENIDISPEREVINNFIEQKEIESWVNARDASGNILKDTLGENIKVREIEKVQARIQEIIRTKDAIITGRAETVDYETGALIKQDIFNHEIHFTSDACTLNGDERALSENVRKRVNFNLLPFPQDYEMVEEGSYKMHDNFISHIRRLDLFRYFEKVITPN